MTTALICLCITYPVAILLTFIFGIYIGARAEEYDKPMGTVKPVQRKFDGTQEEYIPTEEERIRRIIDENIDNFGTGKPQREVK